MNEAQCEELWLDIQRAESKDRNLFIGTIVCGTVEGKPPISNLEIIDGQQRLMTVSLIMRALSRFLELHPTLINDRDSSAEAAVWRGNSSPPGFAFSLARWVGLAAGCRAAANAGLAALPCCDYAAAVRTPVPGESPNSIVDSVCPCRALAGPGSGQSFRLLQAAWRRRRECALSEGNNRRSTQLFLKVADCSPRPAKAS